MKDKLIALFHKHREIITYVFFGGLTTVVNFLVYYPLYNYFDQSATLSNIISWVVAVIFAYFTNKPFVFKSNDWSLKTCIPEFAKFVGSRFGSGLLETVIIRVTVDILLWNGNVWKVLVSVIVVILNYITSKFFAFKNKKSDR